MNVAEALSREVVRITRLQLRYESLRNMPNVNVGPVLMMIERSLEAAHVAAGTDDAVAQIGALKNLQGYTE